MFSNWKKTMRAVAGLASMMNGFWAFQLQAGNAEVDFIPVATAVLAVWACYFSLLWTFQGMRSDP